MTASSTGKFITLEGGEGAGKSTAKAFIAQALESRDLDLVETREPGGTELGEILRNLLISTELKPSVTTELLLIFAARAQHLSEVIEPALAEGKWGLCDRFTDATYAYQGAGRNLGMDKVATLETFVQEDLRPDLTIILDIPVELGMQRVRNRGELDRFETEKIDFFKSVRQAYLDLAKQNEHRYRVVDTSVSLDQVQLQIAEYLDQFISADNL